MTEKRYEIIRKLGAGGMAAVYLAHDKVLDRDVALKILAGSDAQVSVLNRRFKRECGVCCKLRHPNVIKIFDYGRREDGSFRS